MKQLKVLFVGAELNPLAKVGGLGDVVGALPKALKHGGIDVRIALPKYGSIDNTKYPSTPIAEGIPVPFNGTEESIGIFQTPLPGSDVPIYLIDNYHYLGQNGVYFDTAGPSDNPNREAERFTFFARSCFSLFESLGWYPDLIHCNDWHTGMIPVLLKILARNDPKLKNIKTLLTIHNLAHQGWHEAQTIFHILGITAGDYPTLQRQQDGHISSLRQAILASDYINTVSPTYAREILTEEYGCGLNNDLNERADDLTGILNGIDVDSFNPETDKRIAVPYSSGDLSGKAKCKAALQKHCALPVRGDVPLFGIVSRLVDQKGVDLIYEVAEKFFEHDVQFVVLGTGEKKYENMMLSIAKQFPEKTSVHIEFNAALAQQIYAGSDAFLMPSRFEPCGLGQMIAMRFGTLPIVRATGGLKDTVADWNGGSSGGEGFVFGPYDTKDFLAALTRAIKLYSDRKSWYTVVKRIMQKDFSWDHSASAYIKLYTHLVNPDA
ncbi:MAG: glycogen/starch synthase [Patescibacteria group bacterium]